MIPRVTEARYVSGRTIWLRFNDGAEGEIDLSALPITVIQAVVLSFCAKQNLVSLQPG